MNKLMNKSWTSLGFDLTVSGWVGGATAYLGGATAYRAGVLDGIKAISAQLGLGFGLSLAITSVISFL